MSRSARNQVYSSIIKIAAANGINVKVDPKNKYPISDTNDHFGLRTPQDYRIVGELMIVQNDATRDVVVKPYNFNDDPEKLNELNSKIEKAFEGVGMVNIETIPQEKYKHGLVAAKFKDKSSMDSDRHKLATELEALVEKPGAEVENPQGKSVGAAVAKQR